MFEPYKKKPVVIHAWRFSSGGLAMLLASTPGLDKELLATTDGGAVVNTPNGYVGISDGDWLICGVNGEYYPCKDDVFRLTYEDAE